MLQERESYSAYALSRASCIPRAESRGYFSGSTSQFLHCGSHTLFPCQGPKKSHASSVHEQQMPLHACGSISACLSCGYVQPLVVLCAHPHALKAPTTSWSRTCGPQPVIGERPLLNSRLLSGMTSISCGLMSFPRNGDVFLEIGRYHFISQCDDIFSRISSTNPVPRYDPNPCSGPIHL